VLSQGGYDVLPKPLEKAEVLRIISLAWMHWKQQAHRKRPMGSPVAHAAAS
jgi:hypothetical protein